MTLEQLLAKANGMPQELQRLIESELKQEKSRLLFSVKRRLYDKGVDGRGLSLGKYAPSTIRRKRRSAFSRTSHVTLRDTGQWYNSLFVSLEGNSLFLDSSMKALTAILIDGQAPRFPGYGEGILEFSAEEIQSIQTTLDRIADRIADELSGQNIDIDINL